MAQQTINIGIAPNTNTGDPIRTAFTKVNDNFTELYTFNLGQTAGSTTQGFVNYNATTKTAGQFYGGTTAPDSTTRLNFDGYLYATRLYGDASGLTSVPAGNLTGTIPSAVLGNSSFNIGTTSIALNRSSGVQSLTGVSIDGNAGTVTNGVYTTGSYADPSWITSLDKSKVGLGNVENTALSTWAGSTNITTIGAATATSLSVTGNLTVNGTTTTVNSTTVTIDDPILTLGGDTAPTTDDNKDRGIEFRWHNGTTGKLGFFGFDDSTGKFTFIPDATNTSEVFSGTKGTIDANLEWADVLNKPDPVVTVTLTGDVTGTANATLTDLGNGTISIATTVAADSVALGTDTTGNYVASVATTAPLSGGAAGSEGAGLTLSLASGYGDTQNPFGSKTANTFLAAPNGSAGAPTFRAIAAADIPTLNQNTTGNAATATNASNAWQLGTDITTKSNALQYWQLSGNDTLNPTTDWHYAFRMSHGDAETYYSATLAFNFFSDTIQYRRKTSGTNASWVTLLHSGNYNSYSPTLTGTGASGTWSINVTGNAGSATTAAKTSATTVPASTAFSKWLFATTSTGGTLDWNDSSNTIPGVGSTLLLGSATNGPGGGNYYHPFNIQYAGIDGAGQVTQMAVAYGTPGNELYMRGRYDGSWSSWVRFLNSNNYTSFGGIVRVGGYAGDNNVNWNTLGNTDNTIYQVNQEAFNLGSGTGSSNFPTNRSYSYGLLLNLSSSVGNAAQAQIYISHAGNDLVFRGGWYGSSWQTWNRVLTDQNYSSYALPISGGTLTGTLQNGSIWINNGVNNNNYNENIRLFNAPNGVSVIAFSASGVSGTPTTSILGYSDRQEIRFNDGWQQRVYNGYAEASGSYRAPIFYDSNDTSFYLDPNATTSLKIAGNIEQGNNLGRPNLEWNASGNSTGMVIFSLPGAASTNYGMVHMVFDYYEYVTGRTATVIIGGHNWSTSWYETGCTVIGNLPKEVRLGVKDGKYCVVFGVAGSTWNYGTIRLRKIHNAGFYDNILDVGGSYSVVQTTTESFTNVTGDLRQFYTPKDSYAYAYRGHSNVAGTGEASFHPAGVYSTGTNWLYGSIITNNNTINSGTGSISGSIFYDSADTAYYVDPAGNGTRAAYLNGNLWINPKSESYSEGIAFNMPSQGTWGGLRWYRNGAAGSYAGNWAFGYFGNETNNDIGFHNGTNGWRLDHSFNNTVTGSVRSPIFYDSDNTGYYVDPAGSARLNEIYGNNVYLDLGGWFRAYGTSGLYSQSYGNHFYATSDSYWNIAANNGSVSGLIFRTGGHQGTVRGYVYSDSSNNIGFLNSGGSWRLRVVGDDYTLSEGSSIRGQLFYDSNDTNYYVDPASTSVMNRISTVRTNNWLYLDNNYGHSVVGVYSSYRLQGVFAMGNDYKLAEDGTTAGSLYGLAWSHPNAGSIGGANNLNDHGLLIINNGSFRAALSSRAVFSADVRGTLFYDYNDTAYYCDPNSTSYLHTLLLSGSSYFRPQNWIQLDSAYGLYWPNTNGAHVQGNDLSSYGSIAVRGSRSGWRGIHFYDGGNVPHLMFDGSANGGVYFETGGRWASYYSYSDNCWGFGTSSTNSAFNIYCPTGIYSGGRSDGTIFYDSNDTGYYVDPNGTTRLVTLNVIGDITVGVGQTSSNIYFTDSDEGTRRMHCNSNRIGFLSDSNSWGSYCGDGGEWYSDQSVRSPIFYDNNDTGYYSDQASTSRYNYIVPNKIKCVGSVNNEPRWDFSAYVVEAQHWYGNNSSMTMYLGESASNVIQSYNFRSNIFYDRDDTDGVIDPVGHSRLKTAGHVSSGNVSALEIKNTGGTGDADVAAISWHCSGQYGLQMHLRHDGYFGIGGWSASSWRWYVNNTNGDMTAAGNITAYSDPRLKEEVTPITSPIEKIKQLTGVHFRWKQISELGKPGSYDYGVLATDVEKIAPELVCESAITSPDGDRYKTVAYDKLAPFLIEAVKEQQKIIDAQEERINRLEKLVEKLTQ